MTDFPLSLSHYANYAHCFVARSGSKSLQSVITLLCYCTYPMKPETDCCTIPCRIRNSKIRPQARLPVPLPGEMFSCKTGIILLGNDTVMYENISLGTLILQIGLIQLPFWDRMSISCRGSFSSWLFLVTSIGFLTVKWLSIIIIGINLQRPPWYSDTPKTGLTCWLRVSLFQTTQGQCL